MSSHGEGIRLSGENLTRLVENGFNPIPVQKGSKHPAATDNWRRFCWQQPDESDIADWSKDYAGSSIGCACGNSVAAVDIDSGEETRTKQVIALAESHLGSTPLIRWGRPDRVAMIYRCAEPIISAGYSDVDILGLGAQFVAYGVHPRTRLPYVWNDGSGPLNTACDSLPAIDNDQVDSFMRAIVKLSEPKSKKTRRLQIDNISLLAPLSSTTVMIRMLVTRYLNGQNDARRRARALIDKKYFDTGKGLKVGWIEDDTSVKNDDEI
ncbi:bifunctional DNA primase/polymerase [Oricola indica]|jgi:hypothetical protein|uniref:bifunctional DNA primase/polymerase n=2 Tax=Oricola indica TaxID=2872591 RepID=UPI001CBE0459|nr:bifunctional DNA primase/polymerase [Oricola indica]